jgi:hypothetical protein
MQGNAELDKLDLLGGPTIENGTMRYQLSDMLCYLRDGADVVLDEGNTIKPECADMLHSLTDEARQIEVPGYGLVKMAPISSFTITMNEDYAGTNFMNEATIDRFTPIQMSQPDSISEILRRVVPEADEQSLRVCDVVYSGIRDKIRAGRAGARGHDHPRLCGRAAGTAAAGSEAGTHGQRRQQAPGRLYQAPACGAYRQHDKVRPWTRNSAALLSGSELF